MSEARLQSLRCCLWSPAAKCPCHFRILVCFSSGGRKGISDLLPKRFLGWSTPSCLSCLGGGLQQRVVSSLQALLYISRGCESPEACFLRSCPLSAPRLAWVMEKSPVCYSCAEAVSLCPRGLPRVCSLRCLGCTRGRVSQSPSSSAEHGVGPF